MITRCPYRNESIPSPTPTHAVEMENGGLTEADFEQLYGTNDGEDVQIEEDRNQDDIEITLNQPVKITTQKDADNEEADQVERKDTGKILKSFSQYAVDIDSLIDTPWRMPGADLTEYFNYGFTEDTWRAYCKKQVELRSEFNARPYAGDKSKGMANTGDSRGVKRKDGREPDDKRERPDRKRRDDRRKVDHRKR